MPLVDTHAAYTEAWECDYNAHLNVQFYFKRFQEAAAAHHALAGRTPSRLRARHVRYHREQRLDSAAITASGLVTEGPFAGRVLHVMRESPGGALVATALDTWDDPKGLPGEASAEDLAPAAPRGVSPDPAPPVDARDLLARGKAVVSDVSVADPAMFDAAGGYLPHHVVGRFSNAGAHLWNFAGVTTEWLAERNLGRVAVETKLDLVAPIRPGAVLRLISWLPDLAEKTLMLAHQLEDLSTGEAVARGEVRALLMDLSARRATAIPAELREAHETIRP